MGRKRSQAKKPEKPHDEQGHTTETSRNEEVMPTAAVPSGSVAPSPSFKGGVSPLACSTPLHPNASSMNVFGKTNKQTKTRSTLSKFYTNDIKTEVEILNKVDFQPLKYKKKLDVMDDILRLSSEQLEEIHKIYKLYEPPSADPTGVHLNFNKLRPVTQHVMSAFVDYCKYEPDRYLKEKQAKAKKGNDAK